MLTSVYPHIAGISALSDCVNCLITKAFCAKGGFLSGNFVHNVWFKIDCFSKVKIISILKCSFTKYLACRADFLSGRNPL
jgi:hypothetical protein